MPENIQLSEYADIKDLITRLDNSNVPKDLKNEAYKMLARLYNAAKHGSYSGDFELVSKYLDWIMAIPWNIYSRDRVDLEAVQKELDSTHYGLQKVKKQILSYIAIMKMHELNDELAKQGVEKDKEIRVIEHPPVLCFVGLQGLGKTTIAMSIARALGRKFQRISMAAFGDILQLRGKPKTYPDAEPGVIIKALVKAQTSNPVLLLDEIDKASAVKSLSTDIQAALLEILDPSQNDSFVDRYIDYPVDLSKVFFITTANTLGTLTAALLDRLEVIRFTSYSDDEKIVIGKQYVLPGVIKKAGLKPNQLIIQDDAWPAIVRPMGYDAGIRQLKRTLMNLARKVAYDILMNGVDGVKITPENVKKYMPDDMGVLG